MLSRLKVILVTSVILLFSPIIGSAFSLGGGFNRLRQRPAPRWSEPAGLLFASAYAAAVILLRGSLPGHDLFLLGIVVTAYRFTWRSAAWLLVIACVVSVAIEAPNWYRLASFAIAGVAAITVVARLKTGQILAGERTAALVHLQQAVGTGFGD